MRRNLFFCFQVAVIPLAFVMLAGVSSAYKLDLPSGDDRWIKLETTNFIVVGNADEKTVRKTAVNLEYLWAILARQLDGVPPVSPVPTTVYVFDFFSDAYPLYGPFKKGKPTKSGGFFIGRQPANYIAIVERDYRFPDQLDILSDFLHSVIEANVPELPLWLEKGLVEYYSVFHIAEGRAHIGYRVNRHIAWLRNKPLMPLSELLAIDRNSPEFNQEDRNGIFLAESWLLTHLLLTEIQDGRAQTARYAELLRRGVDRNQAFASAFATTYEELEEHLKKYIRARSHHYSVVPLNSKAIRSIAVSRMTHAEVLSRLGDLLVSGLGERHDFAAEHFNAALSLDKSYGPAYGGLGLLDQMAGRSEAALAHFERAAELAPDDERINLLLGMSLAGGLGDGASDEVGPDQLQRARVFLRRAADLRPDLVEPWAELGATYLSAGMNCDPGIEALERAMEIQPKHPDVGINLATLYAHQGSASNVESVIARLVTAGVDARALRRAQEIAAQMESEADLDGQSR